MYTLQRWGKGQTLNIIRSQKKSKIVSRDEALDNLYYSRPPFDEMEVTAVWGSIYKSSIAKKFSLNHM